MSTKGRTEGNHGSVQQHGATAGGAAARDRPITLDVQVLGRDYRVACKEHERADLVEAVAYLDSRMREIRDAGKVTSVERIAVMAALNIAHELLRDRREVVVPVNDVAVDEASVRRRIGDMQRAIDKVLSNA